MYNVQTANYDKSKFPRISRLLSFFLIKNREERRNEPQNNELFWADRPIVLLKDRGFML